MSGIKFFIGLQNHEANPVGWEEFGLVRKYEVKGNRITVNTDALNLVNEDYQVVRNWTYSQWGAFIDIPATLQSTTSFTDRMYLAVREAVYGDSQVKIPLRVRQGNDHFFERANGLTYRLLKKENALPDSIFVDMPYQIVKDYTDLEKLILIFTFFSLLQTTYTIVKEAGYLISEAANPFNVVVLILKLILYAIWLVATIILLIKTFIEIKEIVFPKVRYLKMASDYDLINAGCQYLGFTLQSNYLLAQKDTHFILPVPEAKIGNSIFEKIQNELSPQSFNQGYPTELDSVQTLWDLIEEKLEFENLEIFIKDGFVRIEKPEYFDSVASLTLPRAFSNQEINEDEYSFGNDPDETYRRKLVAYKTDYTDSHSPDIAGQIRAESFTDVNSFPPDCKDLINLSGMVEKRSRYALLKRKDNLLPGEKFIKKIAQLVVDPLCGTGFAGQIQDRIGIGLIGTQFYGNTKRVYANRTNGKQPKNYLDLLSADKIYDENHVYSEVKNRWARRYKMTVPMHPENFNSLQTNNRFYLSTGEQAKALDITYYESPSRRYAEIVYQIPDEANFNVKNIRIT